MDSAGKVGLGKELFRCQRCSGLMVLEKFYGGSDFFFGWRCLNCGEILDPVIFLHRISGNANLHIPENEADLLFLIQRYLNNRQKVAPKPLVPAARLPMRGRRRTSENYLSGSAGPR